MPHNMHEDIAKVLLSKETIKVRVRELADRIMEDYEQSEELVVVCILKGRFRIFCRPHPQSKQAGGHRLYVHFELRQFPRVFGRGADQKGSGHQHPRQGRADH